MHIILLSSRMARAKSLTLNTAHFVAAGLATAGLVLALATGMLYLTVRYAAQIKLPLLENMLATVQEREARRSEGFLRENLNAMAVKLGQMQAQLIRLDALGERVSALAGLKPGEFRFGANPGRGGALSTRRIISVSSKAPCSMPR